MDFYEEKQNGEEIKEENKEDINDIGIEFTPIYDDSSIENEKNEIVFVSLFKIEKKEDELEIKCVSQKLNDGAGNNG